MPNGDDRPDPKDVEAAILLEAGSMVIANQQDELEQLRAEVKQLKDILEKNPDAFGEIVAERDRLLKAREIASYNIIELTAQRDMLSKCLANALGLVTQLMDDLRHANVSPSIAAVVAKTKLDYETRALIARYGGAQGTPEDVTPS